MVDVSLYALLRVDRDAAPAAIKKAYYALARKVHPDKRPGDEGAAAAFLALKKAYDVLSDPARRRRYDRTGVADDDAEGFAAAYARYKGVDVTAEDVEAAEAEYRASADERADVVAYARRHGGDLSRILEAIVGSRDEDADRYKALAAAGGLPAAAAAAARASRVLTLAELEAGAEELGDDDDESSEAEEEDDDDDDDEEDEDDDDDDPEAKVDLAESPGGAAPEAPADLLAMFASRRQERQRGFDAFAARCAEADAEERAAKKRRGGGGTRKK